MKLVHYRKVSLAQDCRNNGIAMQRKSGRLSGVYASPLLDFPRAVTNNWKRELSRDRRLVLAGIVFEIPDEELVYFAKDWSHTALGARSLITAKQAEALAIEQGLNSLKPLTSTQRENSFLMEGDYGQPCYDYGLLEVIVPRTIKPDEIIRIEFPAGQKKPLPAFHQYDEECDWEVEQALTLEVKRYQHKQR
ncbi:hypothetical protein BH10CYA1_BH10CYA1_53700 [soil metagenome]